MKTRKVIDVLVITMAVIGLGVVTTAAVIASRTESSSDACRLITNPNEFNGGMSRPLFRDGVVCWSPTTNTAEIHGAILDAWTAQGSETGALGFPTSDEFLIQGGRQSNFQGGNVTWTETDGAVVQLNDS